MIEDIQKSEIIIYKPDGTTTIDIMLQDETVWLTQSQMVELFHSSKANVSEHIKNIFSTQELDEKSTARKFRTVQQEGNRQVARLLDYYNLDVIIAIGYRINTKQGTLFRQWATRTLKEYILRGYAINTRFERLEQRVSETERIINFFVSTTLPPKEGIFFNGQVFDAYTFVADLIRSAKQEIVLIDNYVDDSVLLLLSKRKAGIKASIYTAYISSILLKDIERHNSQYPSIEICRFENSHDRFLLIDDVVYHIGASLKDLGKKWFAFSRMEMSAQVLLAKL